MSEHPLVAIVGPTGSGKSELALSICERFGGEVVNCDSVQLYRGFDIGTAKLPVAERRGIPHHLIDMLSPGEVFTAGEYARRARPVLAGIRDRGRLPVVVGGTGFYLRALIDGLVPGPSRDDRVRARLDARCTASLYRILSRLDREAARRIAPRDRQKLTRALEVCLLTRRPLTSWFA
ncbi:MAG: tRNA (adenosine(37)-N6)-dimethylallyltransferase MiaA, partial [Bryobacteraceae bacterium]